MKTLSQIGACIAFGASLVWIPVPASSADPSPTAPSATRSLVLDLVAAGQLVQARKAAAQLDAGGQSAAIRKLIDDRAALARRLVDRARQSMAKDDLVAGERLLTFALEIDTAIDATDVIAEHQRRSTLITAEIDRTRACAAQRNFSCLQNATQAARQYDRHHPSAMFWKFYANDWRPKP